jgi:hypothetical protein
MNKPTDKAAAPSVSLARLCDTCCDDSGLSRELISSSLPLILLYFYEHTPNVFNVIKFVRTVVHLHTKLVSMKVDDRQSFAVLR